MPKQADSGLECENESTWLCSRESLYIPTPSSQIAGGPGLAGLINMIRILALEQLKRSVSQTSRKKVLRTNLRIFRRRCTSYREVYVQMKEKNHKFCNQIDMIFIIDLLLLINIGREKLIIFSDCK